MAQVESNAVAADLDLTDEEDAQLTGASDRFDPVTGVQAVPKLIRRRLPV